MSGHCSVCGETGGCDCHKMTPTEQPTPISLAERLRLLANGARFDAVPVVRSAADALEASLAREAKLVEELAAMTETVERLTGLLRKAAEELKRQSDVALASISEGR